MHRLPVTYDARTIEGETRAFWGSRSLPPPDAAFGPPGGRLVRVVTGPIPFGPAPLSDALRLARLDAEVRVLELLGVRSYGQLRIPLGSSGDRPAAPEDPARLYGVWVGGGGLHLPTSDEVEARRSAMERLAEDGLLVTVSVPVRVCSSCRRPHSPQSVIHQEEEGSAYLVRFALQGVVPATSLLVWTDRAWKLLATTALLVSPNRNYAVVLHRRKGVEERLVCLSSSVAELRKVLPDSEFQILEERVGSSFAGVVYTHPLAMESPAVAQLPAPGGTVVPAKELEEEGTGILALTPAHGVADAEVARNLQIPGWPIVGVDGVMTRTVQHKYAGLALLDAEAFILRDLIDDGAVFAQLPVRRGVPRCASCGTVLFWTPARLWSLSPDRLPSDRQQLYQRVLPGEPLPASASVMPWPISEYAVAEPGAGIPLSECPLCERLGPPTEVGHCACGGSRTVVRRRLLPEFEEALAAWSTAEAFPDGTGVRLIVPDRRRGPTLVHHLAAMHAGRRKVGELRLVPLPAMPSVGLALGEGEPLDALRAALLRTINLPAGRATLEGNRRQEAARLRRAWQTCGQILELFERSGWSEDPGPIATQLSTLYEEDRAFLSIFERMRIGVIRSYEAGDLAAGLDRLLRFFETDLRRGYLRVVATRLAAPGSPPAKISVLRTLSHIVPLWITLYAPGAPFTAEALWRAFRGDAFSVGEVVALPPMDAALDAEAESSYARWWTIRTAMDRSRRRFGLEGSIRLPTVVLMLRDEGLASKLRQQVQAIARFVNADVVAVASPEHPWEGRKIEARPVIAEIQRAFGVQTPRIVRMLSGFPLKRVQDGIRNGSISLALEGNTITLTPNMIEVIDGLPEGTVPIPWSGGELFVTLPEGANPESAHPPPALSLDGYRVLRAIERRIRPLPPDTHVTEVVIRVDGPLGQELAKQAASMARFLHVLRLRLAEAEEFLPDRETTHGRTGRGVGWSIWMPGIPKPVPAPRSPRRPSGMSRAPPAPEFMIVPEEQLEFVSEPLREREREIRDLLEKLDQTAMPPILGMTKLGGVWDLGLHSPEQIAAAPFEPIATLPGFGRLVAAELVRSVGGQPPPSPPRRRKPVPVAAAIREQPREETPFAEPFPARATPPGPESAIGPPSELSGPEIVSSPPSGPARVPAPASSIRIPDAAPVPGSEALPSPERFAANGPTDLIEGLGPEPIFDDAVPEAPVPEVEALALPGGAPEPEEAGVDDSLPTPVFIAIDSPALTPDLGGAAGSHFEGPTTAEPPEAAALAEIPTVEFVQAPEPVALPPEPPAPPALSPDEGIQLRSTVESDSVWTRFLEATAAGHRGLCLTREFPDRVRLYLGNRDVEVVWISPVARSGSLRPSDLAGIAQKISSALETRGATAVYFEGIEYLVSLHSAEKALAPLRELDRLARLHHARIWIPVNPDLLQGPELDRLLQGFETPVP